MVTTRRLTVRVIRVRVPRYAKMRITSIARKEEAEVLIAGVAGGGLARGAGET